MKTTFVLLAIFSLHAPAQVGLGLAPMRLEIDLEPGATYSGALDLTNQAGGTIRIRGEILDFQIDETTTPQFRRQIPSESANSCREWLIANPMDTEVAATEHLVIRYTFRVPQSATPGSYNCAVGYTTLPAADTLKQTGLKSAVRLVASFYVIVGKPTIEGEISGLQFEPVPGAKDGSWQTILVLRNLGPYHFRPIGSVHLLSATGATLETIEVPAFPALPRREQRYVIPVNLPNPSEVRKIKASVDLGSHEIQEAFVDVAPIAALR